MHFNPRSREGSDYDRYIRGLWVAAISIHAPAKGATFAISMPICIADNFNPRSREGSDKYNIMQRKWRIEFQSTLPRRERLTTDDFFAKAMGFQSTLPRRERLLYPSQGGYNSGISIHAPAKGATKNWR